MGQVNIGSSGTSSSRLYAIHTGLVRSLHGGRQFWLARMLSSAAGWERDHRLYLSGSRSPCDLSRGKSGSQVCRGRPQSSALPLHTHLIDSCLMPARGMQCWQVSACAALAAQPAAAGHLLRRAAGTPPGATGPGAPAAAGGPGPAAAPGPGGRLPAAILLCTLHALGLRHLIRKTPPPAQVACLQ